MSDLGSRYTHRLDLSQVVKMARRTAENVRKARWYSLEAHAQTAELGE